MAIKKKKKLHVELWSCLGVRIHILAGRAFRLLFKRGRGKGVEWQRQKKEKGKGDVKLEKGALKSLF